MIKNNKKDKKLVEWKKPVLNRLSVHSTKGGSQPKQNESLTADHYDSRFGGATGSIG